MDQAPTRRTGSGQSSTPQGAKGSSGHSQSTSARPSIRRTLQAAPPVKQAPTGVLIEPHNGETIGLSPAMVAEMEIAKLSHLEPERSLSGLPAVTKDTPSSSVNDSTKAFYEDLSGLVDFGPPKEGVLIDFAEDVAVVRPAECVGTCSTHLPREGVSGVEGDDKIDNHSGLEDWANEDEVVFQGNRAMGIRANIGVLVGADDGLQTVPSAGDAQIEKNSEEIISQ